MLIMDLGANIDAQKYSKTVTGSRGFEEQYRRLRSNLPGLKPETTCRVTTCGCKTGGGII
jgi:hypothetical protein